LTYYIRLIKFTEKGAQGLNDFPQERAKFLQKATELGIKVHGTYITMGAYDMVTILEAENEKAILKLHTTFAAPRGRTTTQTMTAIPAAEFEQIVKSG